MERNDELDPQRVCTLVLARLLPESKRRPSRLEVVRSVAALLPGVTAAAAAEAGWKLACERGWLGEDGRLSTSGRRELAERLGVQQLPTAKNWLAVQRSVLGRLALGMPVSNAKSNFAADLLCAANSLPPTSLTAAVDRLAWRALGEETDERFTALRAQRYLFRALVPMDRNLTSEQFRQLIAARSLRSDTTSKDELRGAAVRRWVTGMRLDSTSLRVEARGLVVPENDNTNAGATSLERFAAAVVATARKPGVKRFHDDRAFIGSIWEHMRGHDPAFDMPLEAFKAKLVEAHQQKLIRMSRADLVQSIDPSELARSEARHMSGTFHFVALRAGGAR